MKPGPFCERSFSPTYYLPQDSYWFPGVESGTYNEGPLLE